MATNETKYVDQTEQGKAKALDLIAFATACGIKDIAKRYDAYKAKQAEATAMLNDMMAALEDAGGKRGVLEDDMALAPWFKWGQRQVVRVYGPRHGADRKPAAVADSAANVASLFASLKPASRLITRR